VGGVRRVDRGLLIKAEGLSAEGWRVLLLCVPGCWDCPKGLVEHGADALTTATRATREEANLDDLDP
jgi:ADP-ribose pyrophosphatase YjhB (NUDIX family)